MPYPYDIGAINARAAQDPAGYARECEAIFNRKVDEAAAMISERAERSHVVFLSGPSGSGKTTTAQKICEALESIGVAAHSVSLDKYYITLNPDTAPRTRDGQLDRESPYCLDLQLLSEHFQKIERCEEIIIPHFNFKTQSQDKAGYKQLKIEKNEIVIFEGIHALNDMLADKHPDAFKLYISARSDIGRDGGVYFKRTWTRLMRRIVRDSFFRGTAVPETLKMWANVRRGEKKYISPFKYKADLLFDSSMGYEIPVLKRFALEAFSAIPDDAERISELRSLLPVLGEFKEIDAGLVPPDSILREFIGGGKYKY